MSRGWMLVVVAFALPSCSDNRNRNFYTDQERTSVGVPYRAPAAPDSGPAPDSGSTPVPTETGVERLTIEQCKAATGSGEPLIAVRCVNSALKQQTYYQVDPGTCASTMTQQGTIVGHADTSCVVERMRPYEMRDNQSQQHLFYFRVTDAGAILVVP